MDSFLDQTTQAYGYTSLPYEDPVYGSSGMQRTVSEHTDRSGRSTGSNDSHWSAGEYASQASPVVGFDYSVPTYIDSYGKETADTDYLVSSVGSQYQEIEEVAPEYSSTPASTQLLDTIKRDEAAAWYASIHVYEHLSQTPEWKPETSFIKSVDVDQTLSELQRRKSTFADSDTVPEVREAVQQVLRQFLSGYLSRHPRGTTRDQERVTSALKEAAYHFQIRAPCEESLNICYYAIAAVLATLRGEGSETQESRASSSSVAQQSTGQRFVCPVRGCTQGAFGRAADLDRHHKMVHLPDDEKKKFYCDYKKCTRHNTPFYRQDHFRDHLRDFHKEDLPRRGTRADDKWWKSRSTNAIINGWWRCNRCLVTRVDIRHNGWVCPNCNMHCETERQKYRSSGQR